MMSMLMLICGNVMADDVVIDFNTMDMPVSYGADKDNGIEACNDGDILEAKSFEVGGVTVIISPKDPDNKKKSENRFWKTNDGPQLRCYSGTITVKSTSTMKSIIFDAPSKFNLTADKGAMDGKTWGGEATEVVFTVGDNSQINKITVSANAVDITPDDPNKEGSVNNPYTVAGAFAVLATMDVNVKSEEVYVKGKISKIDDVNTGDYGNATYYISDNGAEEGQLEVFRGFYLENKKFTAADQIKVGDEVIVCGILVNYRSSKAAETDPATPEITQPNYIYSLNGKTKAEGGDTPQPQDIEQVNVAKALEIINALEDGKTTSVQYDVKGFVISIEEISEKNDAKPNGYGNATFVIADSKTATEGVKVFRAKGFENQLIDDPDIFSVGDEVVVRGKLQKYVKDGVTTPEISSCYLMSVNGEGSSISSLTIDMENAPVYNLNGQRVVKAQKGLYIIGGKKVMVK